MKIFLTCVVILALMTWALACGGGVEGATMVKDDRLDTDEFQDCRTGYSWWATTNPRASAAYRPAGACFLPSKAMQYGYTPANGRDT